MTAIWFIGSTVAVVQMTIFGSMLGNGQTARQNYVAAWKKVGAAAVGVVELFKPERPKR